MQVPEISPVWSTWLLCGEIPSSASQWLHSYINLGIQKWTNSLPFINEEIKVLKYTVFSFHNTSIKGFLWGILVKLMCENWLKVTKYIFTCSPIATKVYVGTPCLLDIFFGPYQIFSPTILLFMSTNSHGMWWWYKQCTQADTLMSCYANQYQ